MIRIISDSSTLYTINEGKEKNLSILPLTVTINNETYHDFEDITTKDFIDLINNGHMPSSSQPPIGSVIDAYNQYPDDEIINICMADGLSGTYNSACMAKNMDENPDRIEVINSKTLCGPQRYLVDLALSLSKDGQAKDEILRILHETIKSSESFLIPHDYDYLVRGGRLSPLVGKIGSAIKLVPIMTLSEDSTRLEKFSTKRTFKRAIQKLAEHLVEKNIDSNYKIYISHACIEELAEEAKRIILENITDADIEVQLLSPAFTTQGGPGCVAIQYVKKHESVSK